ncbi:MAG: hypothetical protein F4187_05750 [Gemmatimonadetes bacterium]|nr:hypothetical protein [Gammaproteobacteria bacterium]MYG81289.1 hypothetical protein [Gemmatimonadota bacterium]MYI06163.1 hypothetical protein [Gemmatimonadota bacterium]
MDALIGKLTNLGYEFFGILLPGTLAVLMWSLLWSAAGDLVPLITLGAVPELTLSEAMDAIGQAIEWSAFLSVLLMTAVAYFVGHLLTWVARGGKPHEQVRKRDHLAGTLLLRPPKREPSYNLKLKPAWRWAGKRLLGEKLALTWTLFYPAAKTYLLQRRIPSLVTTYQNKYTLHRSLAVAAALTTWGTLLVIVSGLLAQVIGAQAAGPHWFATGVLAVGSLGAVLGFSSSYLYNWTLWGDYLITETYVSLRVEEAHDES